MSHGWLVRNFLFVICLFIASCLPDRAIDIDEFKIVAGEIGGRKYFVPEDYFKFKGAPFSQDNIYLQTMYPDFLPLKKQPLKYWESGEWWKNISILAQYYPNSNLTTNELARNQIEFLKAFEVVGTQYGLIHQRQPEGYIQDHKDVWLDKRNEEILSIITCSESLIEKDFPQCTQHYYILEKLHVKVDFDKRMLENWATIDSGVRGLFNSFVSPEKARSFLQKQILLAQPEYKEKDDA